MIRILNKNELNKLIKSFNDQRSKETAERLEAFLENYLKYNPLDIEMLVKLALTVYRSPLHDDLKAIEYLEKALALDQYNIKITLLLIYIIINCKFFDDESFNKLCKLRSKNKELMSLIEYTKSWYYLFKNDNLMYEKSLYHSIKLCKNYVWNYVDLGRFYIEKGNIRKGYELMQNGLKNLEYIYDEHHPRNILDIEEFFNERFKGIHLSNANYKIILESFDPKSPWITGDFITKKDNDTTEN